LIGDKLYETNQRLQKPQRVLSTLEVEVEFPSIRDLVNSDQVGWADLLRIRDRASRFRTWLQDEADRDRNALIAYHTEVGHETGLAKFGRRTLRLFGTVGPAALGGAVGTAVADPLVGAVLGAGGAAATYLTEIAAKLGTDWSPVVFGRWLDREIRRLVDQK
jgi:hypothetical protein